MEDLNITRLLNNTYEEESIGIAINDIQLSNYKYLYKLQDDLLGYYRFDCSGKDIKYVFNTHILPIKNKYCCKILREFINPNMVYKFRRSKKYNKLLSMNEIESDSMFQYGFIVFIDGILYSGAQILPTEEFSYIVFDNNVYRTDSKITIWVVPNYKIMSSESNVYRIHKNLPKDIIQNIYGQDNFQFIHTLSIDNITSDIVTTSNVFDGNLKVATNLSDKYKGIRFSVNSIGLQNLEGTVITHNQSYFKINRKNMPIVAESMMVFKNNPDGLLFQHDVTITPLYPNIYKLDNIDISAEYYIIYFYFDDTKNSDSPKLIYENRFSLLDKAGINLLEKYKSDTVPNVIKNYDTEEINYSIKDFEKSDNLLPIEYKEKTLKSLIKKDSTNATKYFNNQIDGPTRIYLDVSTIELLSRRRVSTKLETPNNVINFRNPHYVFVLRKHILQDYTNTRIFVDGLIQVFHTVTESEDLLFIYIPCEFVTEKSIVEFESFKTYVITKPFSVVNREHCFDMTDIVFRCNFKDIVITDNSGTIIEYDKYDLYIDMDGEFISMEDKYNTFVTGCIKIVFSDDTFNNIDMRMTIIHRTNFIKQEIITDDDRGKAIYIDFPITRNIGNFRIYRNGKLVPRRFYDIKYRKNLYYTIGVDILIDKRVGDVIVVDISPIQYREVLTMERIPANGFINGCRYLDKPFSLKWYDVYLNGRKLNFRNIDIISPTKLFIKDVSTRYNLSIVDNNRDAEYFGIASDWESFHDKLWEEYPNLKEIINSLYSEIVEIEDNINTNVVSPKSVDKDRFYEFYAKNLPILNPDEDIIHDEIWEHVSTLHEDNIIFIDPDNGYNAPSLLEFINNNEE